MRATKPQANGHAHGVTPSRVLVVGQSEPVLETVLDGLAELGMAATGTTDPAAAATRFHARDFALVAFGGGIPAPLRDALQRTFASQNPDVRLLDAHAPVAVRQIADALRGHDTAPPVDVDAYFARIGYRGPRTPTLDTLRSLIELHPAAIVFEAIDVLLDRSVDLAPAAVDAKLIGGRRGGYCFEQNGLMQRVLEALGFRVEGLAARVRWMAPALRPPVPRTHMVLRVTLDGVPWLVDVGFGGNTPTAPLRMDRIEPQPTPHETFRVFPFGSDFLVQARLGEAWMSLYEVAPDPQLPVDYELANWYTATHPDSHFRHGLRVARTSPDARYALAGNRLTIRRPDGGTARRTLHSDGIAAVLASTFRLEVQPEWRPIIERAADA